MRENRTSGSVQGALGNQRSYCKIAPSDTVAATKPGDAVLRATLV
jgi:hypothetical protein